MHLNPSHTKRFNQHVAFVHEWSYAADRFLAGGFINPAKLIAANERYALCEADMPTPLPGTILLAIHAAGEDGFAPDEAYLLRAIRAMRVGGTIDDIRQVIYADGTDVSIDHFGRLVRKFGLRARAYRFAVRFITDPRPIGEIIAEFVTGLLAGLRACEAVEGDDRV